MRRQMAEFQRAVLLNELVGAKLVGVRVDRDVAGSKFGDDTMLVLVFERADKQTVEVAVQSDQEGNDVGWLDVAGADYPAARLRAVREAPSPRDAATRNSGPAGADK